ncbi:queuosine precursor transporter [Curtanaerobium respiraculi]|uniref:queuosine precursor transporter n=1 Tax=Curtanaerobium respiraculi TaxID=2949669 RepID=UPI0024B33903|nr:queuosine precursor transporter [Curtanaerobium respiraculi]
MKRSDVLAICAALATMSIIVSNIITNKQLDFLGLALPAGSLLIPVDYIIGDLVAEVYGFRDARRIILLAFAMNALAVAFFMLALALPGFSTFTAQASFETVLGTTPRILVASLTAFAVGSLSNAKIMQVMHARDGESRLAWRCIASTLVGETLDMTVFSLLAFAGVLPWNVILQMIVLNSVVKVAIEIALYALATRHVIRWAKTLS